MIRLAGLFGALTILLLGAAEAQSGTATPRLEARGTVAQLIVDDSPFLVLGGELGNSTASSLREMDRHWNRLEALNLNTVLAPVYWELIEPQEGVYDFSLVDGLVAGARERDMRLVLLWFGSWKNSMSSYAPAWVKRDEARFPRARDANGRAQEILSPFYPANLQADRRAFAALMAHLSDIDARERTVIMVQVENEIGMIPSARDHSEAADAAFAGPVPRAVLEARGMAGEGNWEDVFGPGPATDELFMAWHFARYVDAIAEAGKAEYDLPMYVNAALNRPGRTPGEYPSAGPLPHLFDIWTAGAPSIDFLAPDIYFPNFTEWMQRFARAGNPLFIPEANRAGRAEGPADAFYAFGELAAIGYSPFSIENAGAPESILLDDTYATLRSIAPILLDAQADGRVRGFRSAITFDGTNDDSPQAVELGGYSFTVHFVDPWTPREDQRTDTHGGLIVQLGPNEFLVAGHGVTLTFATADGSGRTAGIESIQEGRYEHGVWITDRWLNGDESHQGRHLRLPPGRIGVQRLRLYTYD